MSTYLELQNEVLAHGFASTAYRTRVKAWLNEAQARIARRMQLREVFTSTTVTTEVGTVSYALPAAFIRANGLVDPDYPLELRYVPDPDDLLVRNEGGAVTGRPDSYSLNQNGLLLSPTPDAAYSLTFSYYSRPTDMVADDDVSVLPADYHDVMVSYALSRAYRSEDDPQMSQFFYQEFMRDFAQLATDKQFEVRDAPRQVPGMWSI
jgi:hypothetical protein